MTYDLKITGGTIVDGTGSLGFEGDVGIREGRIAALGSAPCAAQAEIDARGRVVSPGFVDIHTHYDAQILWDRMLSISPWHGVTTVVVGNCGFGIAPTRREHRGLVLRTLEKVDGMSLAALEAGFGDAWEFETFPEYLDAIERRGMAINVGVLLGHTPLRLHALGEEASERPASEDEIERMRVVVREALDAGALGFATSKSATHVGYAGRPVPSRLAEFDEIRRPPRFWARPGRASCRRPSGATSFWSSSPSSHARPVARSRGPRFSAGCSDRTDTAACSSRRRSSSPTASRSFRK